MNIGFLLDRFTGGGIGRVVSILGNEMKERYDYNVHALAFTNCGKEDIYPTRFPVTYLYNDKLSMRKAIISRHYLKSVKDFVRDNNIDILIACGVQFFAVTAMIAKRLGIKSICWEHTSPFINKEFVFEKQSRHFGYRNADQIVVLTKTTRDIIQEKYKNKKICQIYNPIDETLLEKNTAYDPDTNRIISVGRLLYQKNFQRAIKLAAALKSQLPGFEWHVYGEGADRGELENMIEQYGVKDTFKLMGLCPSLYDKYSEYSGIVMTSRYEGFPMTLLEAAAAGLPMISFDVFTGPSEIIDNGENGFLCQDSDDEMINAVKKLLTDRELRIKMSENSRKTAENFRLDQIIDLWKELFDEMLG